MFSSSLCHEVSLNVFGEELCVVAWFGVDSHTSFDWAGRILSDGHSANMLRISFLNEISLMVLRIELHIMARLSLSHSSPHIGATTSLTGDHFAKRLLRNDLVLTILNSGSSSFDHLPSATLP